MNARFQPVAQLHHRATEALIRELGVVDTLRFLNQLRAGSGNYTEERQHLFQGLTVRDLAVAIKTRRERDPLP